MKITKLLTIIALVLFSASIAADNFTIGNKSFLLNGQPAPQGFKGVTVSKGKKVMKK